MSERNELVIDLVKEVLGPRNGPLETMPDNQDPRDEYITGVLSPVNSPVPAEDIESEIDDLAEEQYIEGDENYEGSVVVAAGQVSPALDPRALPHSIGISFTVESDGNAPEIEICATWARYKTSAGGWLRNPHIYLTGVLKVTDQSLAAGQGATLKLKSRQINSGVWKLSVYLINTTSVATDQRPATEEYIFQPQIRINCCKSTKLIPARDSRFNVQSQSGSMEAEENSLSLLYREYPSFARGHLCAAIWKEIDPERPHQTIPSPANAPFFWTDGYLLSSTDRERFSPPQIRTELVPCFPVESPFMEWDNRFPAPVMNPEELAQLFSSGDIKVALQPLVDGYRKWLQLQETAALTLSAGEQITANAHIQQCFRIAERLQESVNLLASDENVRLSFNFANKAIAIQSGWRGRSLIWRPFQLAFILLNIPAISNPSHTDRAICDLLWFPTGGGKTESYLGLAAFTIALRRRKSLKGLTSEKTGAGVSVISRYTLRLLTIQQFRRALSLITACEYLRVYGLNSLGTPVGWRPDKCRDSAAFIWGGCRFSIGLWVGGNVTPNSLNSVGPILSPNLKLFAGALDILQGVTNGRYTGNNPQIQKRLRGVRDIEADGEPAQVLSCPCCETILAVPTDGIEEGQHTLHFVFRSSGLNPMPSPSALVPVGTHLVIDNIKIFTHRATGYFTLALTFTIPAGEKFRSSAVDLWWSDTISRHIGSNTDLVSSRPARPGYFLLSYQNNINNKKPCDFDIYCPNPDCELNQHAWAEQIPVRRDNGAAGGSTGFPATSETNALPPEANLQWQTVPEQFSYNRGINRIAGRIPIPALTVDDQIYHRCPTLIIATVDKFARLAFEPKAGSIFGNVDYYHSRWGYYRTGCPPSSDSNLPARYAAHPPIPQHRVAVSGFNPPELILQDELHLIEGPLGSMFGIYEAAIDELCSRNSGRNRTIPKYIASTATVRQAETQTRSLFNRDLHQFPPSAISISDRFFARQENIHPLECERSGRLYTAICAPGKGAQTPNVRIWSVLLQKGWELWQRNPRSTSDNFFTLVGYFNATRELAGTTSLYRQDIPERMEFRWGINKRIINSDRLVELSGRADSLSLPSILKNLENIAPEAEDAVFATSMFGTGVDIDRLGLMVVHGQPKTTASYIQATGRVGRKHSGLVTTFFRASRPRDLDHYEFFTGYHQSLYRYVEPIAVAPFSPRARERALGPLVVLLLRNAGYISNLRVNEDWRIQQRLSGKFYSLAGRMQNHRYDPEVKVIGDIFELRSRQQPIGRQPLPTTTQTEVDSEIDRWQHIASIHNSTDRFVYCEPSLIKIPQRHVVLGDAQHRQSGLSEAYENSPQSLRDVEETTGFKT